jgi:hypothetical protein
VEGRIRRPDPQGDDVVKVVIFCGGRVLRIARRPRWPQAEIPIGSRPVLWHVMNPSDRWASQPIR